MNNQNILRLAKKFGFILTDDETGIDWASNYDKEFEALVTALLKEINNK